MDSIDLIKKLVSNGFCQIEGNYLIFKTLYKEYKVPTENLINEIEARASEDYYLKGEPNDSEFFAYVRHNI